MWESEVMFFLMVVVMFRTRRSGARTLIAYVSMATFYAKACNCLLWGSTDPVLGIVYFFILMVHFVLVGEPVPPKGPEQVTYFEGLEPLTEALKDPECIWLVAFYTTWAPNCAQLAPIFAELSNNYTLPNMKWAKVDVGRHQDVAAAHHINITPLSLQLPTLAMYRGGKKLLMRRPTTDSKNKFQRFYFTPDNIVAAYDLNNVMQDQKKLLNQSKASRPKAD